jgi:hypothetical protein
MASRRNRRVVSLSSPYVAEERQTSPTADRNLGPTHYSISLICSAGPGGNRARRMLIELRIFEDPNEMVGDSGSFD